MWLFALFVLFFFHSTACFEHNHINTINKETTSNIITNDNITSCSNNILNTVFTIKCQCNYAFIIKSFNIFPLFFVCCFILFYSLKFSFLNLFTLRFSLNVFAHQQHCFYELVRRHLHKELLSPKSCRVKSRFSISSSLCFLSLECLSQRCSSLSRAYRLNTHVVSLYSHSPR